jgi:CheY-like chemotaxis protein
MPLLLVLEDNPTDLRQAADIAGRAGFTEFEVCRFVGDAKRYLEKAKTGTVPLPDAMILDLDLGVESGFETVRMWHGTPQLKPIPVIIWTVFGNHEREMSELFGIYRFVSKEDGSQPLFEALANLIGGTETPKVG